MISCWFSRHCFSLSSVSVSRCSRMETVCKITGGPAQRVQGPPGCPGDVLSQSCSAAPACCPNASCRLCPPRALPGPLVAVGTARAFMSTLAGSEQLSLVFVGRGKALRERRRQVPQPLVMPLVVWHSGGSSEQKHLLSGPGSVHSQLDTGNHLHSEGEKAAPTDDGTPPRSTPRPFASTPEGASGAGR